MILCSKAAYLNILTQLMTADQLLKANYYIIDERHQPGLANLVDNVGINDYGNVEVFGDTLGEQALTQYNIQKHNCLDPEPYKAQALMGAIDGIAPEERYIQILNKPDTFRDVYNFIFRKQLKGNGLQIVIMNDKENMWQFGHIIAQYLSMNFGVDINYIDPKYVSNGKCRGQQQYVGDKSRVATLLKSIKDYDLSVSFQQALSQTQLSHNTANLEAFLGGFKFEDLIYLHNLIFPESPLPPGQYTMDDLKIRIIGRTTGGLVNNQNQMQNLFTWTDAVDMRDFIEQMDFAQDEILD